MKATTPYHRTDHVLAPFVEALEPRIAPAILLNASTVQYTDQDLETVTIKFGKRVLDSDPAFLDAVFGAGFVDGNIGTPQQLKSLNLTDPVFQGVSVSIAVTTPNKALGDGLVNVGQILATGNDLGAVTVKGDLGRILAGDSDNSTPGLRSLTVHSLGAEGTSTGAVNIHSHVKGSLIKFAVTESVVEATLAVQAGGISSIKVGDSLLGGSGTGSGRIDADGIIGKVFIGGDIQGGKGDGSGILSSFASIGKVVIKGDVVALDSGAGTGSGQVRASANINSLSIGGDLIGGSAAASGTIFAGGNLGKIVIGGNIEGGEGNTSGRVSTFQNLAQITVKGSVIGGDVPGSPSGSIEASESIGKVVIGGSLLGGNAMRSGLVLASETITSVKIGGNLEGGGGLLSGSIISENADVRKVLIGGDIQSGAGFSSGSIRAEGSLGTLAIKGDVFGAGVAVLITGQGNGLNSAAIGKLTVGGDVTNALILGGYDSSVVPVASRGDAQIGKISVGGDWTASSIVAGVKNAGFPTFGNANDQVSAGGDPGVDSRIGAIFIKGVVEGTPGGGDHFGFVAQQIGKVSVPGTKVSSPAPNTFIPLGSHGDFNIHVL